MKNKLVKFLKENWVLLCILALGLFLRIINGGKWFIYDHDQDLAGWIIRDVLYNHHFRLIGQLTSTPGVFIGPMFYYLLIPFYLAFKMDPIGGVYMVASLGVFSIWSVYFVFSRIVNKNVGIIGAFIYAISPYIVFNDRRVVPTMPLMLWSIWFLFDCYLIIKGKQKEGFIFAAVLVALIWHVNFGLMILLPLLFLSLVLSRKKINFKAFTVGIILSIILWSPFILFEVRHGFSQIQAVFSSATTEQGDVIKGTEKVKKIYDVVAKDVAGVIWGYPKKVPQAFAFWLVITGSLFLILKKKIDVKTTWILISWFFITTGVFSIYSKPVSEYYLDSLTVVWVFLISLMLSQIITKKVCRAVGYLLIFLFILVSGKRYCSYASNRNGYIERKSVIQEIKDDSKLHNYPCISISYITGPGYNLGYRYFIWMQGLSTREVSTGAPVYSIVFPLSIVDKVDKTFGGIGLIYPDYAKYDEKTITKSCQGDNMNIVGSMFGYTD